VPFPGEPTALAERLESEPAVRAVRAALAEAQPRAWIVGGAIRDGLLGRPVADVDLAVAGEAEPLARSLARSLGAPAFRLSEAFGAWRVAVPDGWVCDVSPLQGETIEADLARRDFTLNALALPIEGGEPLDPHGGARDLEAGVLRVLGPSAYDDDPLRALRLVRFAAELGLAPDTETERLTAAAAARVSEAAGERSFAELRRIMISERALEGIELADRLGLLAAILPELDALHGVEQSHFHHLDVYGHTLEVVREQIALEERLEELFPDDEGRLEALLGEPLADELTRREALRFGALLHDIGKPATRGERPDGRVTFIGHDSVGEQQVHALCRRLRTSERFAGFVGGVTRHHLVLGFLVHQRPLPRDTIYAYLTLTSPVEVEVTLLTCADRLATRGKNADAAIAAHLELARDLMAEALDWRAGGPPAPLLRGDELAAELGIEPGPELGELLGRIEQASFTGEVDSRAGALAFARRVRENRGSP